MNKKDNTNVHAGHRQRMRDKISKFGLENLPEHEILEFLLYPFIPLKDTNAIAHELIEKAGGSLDKVFDAPQALLMSVPNMTRNAAMFLSSMPQIIRLYQLKKLGDKPMLDTVSNAAEYFRVLLADLPQEKMYLAIVNAKGRLVDKCEIGVSNSQECSLNVKDFINRTANSGADNIFIAHNHPSGDPAPSMADYDFTRWLVSLCEIMGLKLIDHIIIASGGYYSFNEHGDLKQYKDVYKDYVKFATAMDKFRM